MRLAFTFPRNLAQEMGIKVIMILNEFQEVKYLQNPPGTHNLSAVAIMHCLMADPTSTLFVQFAQVGLTSFQRDDTAALMEKLFLP